MDNQQQHPITPPPELVQQWANTGPVVLDEESLAYEMFIAHHAAKWGADQELEACRMFLAEHPGLEHPNLLWELLYIARRPKPPSLKAQALEELDGIAAVFRMSHGGDIVCDKIRRALEALPE
jgi:hypothetical protein